MTIDDGKCFECGSDAMAMHHVIPRSSGGIKTIPLCERCHCVVHDKKHTSTSHLTSVAMQRLKSEGKYTGGHVPYGFEIGKEGALIQSVGEQHILSLVRKYKEQGLSLRKIANVLSEQGFRSRAGKALHFQAIARMDSHPL